MYSEWRLSYLVALSTKRVLWRHLSPSSSHTTVLPELHFSLLNLVVGWALRLHPTFLVFRRSKFSWNEESKLEQVNTLMDFSTRQLKSGWRGSNSCWGCICIHLNVENDCVNRKVLYGIWNKNTGSIRNIVAGKRPHRSSFCEEEAADAIPVVFGTSIESLLKVV